MTPAYRSFADQPFLPVIIGGHVGAYSIARAFHEAYGVRSIIVASARTWVTDHSAIVEPVHCANPLDPVALAATLRTLRDWGQEGKYNHVRHGFNFRMDAVQGAALGVKLRHLDGWNAARRRVAQAYQKGLADGIRRPAPIGKDTVSHVYAIQISDRADVQALLGERGIATGIHYPVPVHLQPAYAHLGYKAGDLPVTEALAHDWLSLPLYPEMSDADVATVIEAVNFTTIDKLAGAA